MDFITFTGSLICGKKPDLNADFCCQAQENGMEAIFYYFLQGELPPPYDEIFRSRWLNNCVYMMKQEAGFAELCRKLEAEKIRFAPFKGTDLAFSVYPDPALRTFCDWDILFHPDDCGRAHDFLNRDGWTPKYVYDGKHYGHHYHGRHKGEFHIEPHWTFSGFGDIEPTELWQYINPVEEKRFMHNLSPELNILMLLRHASSEYYTHLNWTRLFTDLSFFVRQYPVDYELLCSMAEKWSFPNPVNIMGAFPEFFLKPRECDTAKSAAWREIFLSQKEFDSANAAEWEMNLPGAYSWSWFRKNIVFFSKRVISSRRQTGRNIFAIIFAEVKLKFTGLCRFTLKRNRKILERHNQVEEAEKNG